ncbi:protein kinase activating protein dpb11 [Thecaphora frezii]
MAFAGCSGIERRALRTLASSLGATVSNELRFDGTVTHLVSATADPGVSSSIRYLLHFQHRARQGVEGIKEDAAANMHVVWPEWLHDCQEAEGCLNELYYSVFAPPPEQSVRSELIAKANRKIPSPFAVPPAVQGWSGSGASQPPKRPRLDLEGGPSSSSTLGARDSGRANGRNGHGYGYGPDEGGEEEEAVIRLCRRADRRQGGGTDAFARVISQIVSKQQGDAASSSSLGPGAPPVQGLPGSTGGLLSISRASSFSQVPTSIKRGLPVKRKSGDRLGDVETGDEAGPSASATASRIDGERADGVERCFDARTIRIDLPDPRRVKVLETTLRDAGARVIGSDQAGPADFCVVPSSNLAGSTKAGAANAVGRPALEARGRPVTHYWIEYCLYKERFVEPDEYFAADPAAATLPLESARQVAVLLAGFGEGSPEMYHARKLIEELGGAVVERLRGSTVSHVLCASEESRSGSRASKASGHGIPIVSLDWLRTARMEGRLTVPAAPVTVRNRSASRGVSESLSRSGGGAEDSSSSSINAGSIGLGTKIGRQPFRSTSASKASLPTGQDTAPSQQENNSLDRRAAAPKTPIAAARDDSGGPLAGCYIACGRSIVAGDLAIERKAHGLGATYQPTPNATTTHLLHRGPAPTRELRELSRETVAVHPSWLDRCYEERIRFDERLFPSTLRPGKALATAVAAPEIEESFGRRLGSSQASQQSAVAAARPWHRSLSAGTAQESMSSAPLHRDRPGVRGSNHGDDLTPLAELEAEQQRGRSASPPATRSLAGEGEELDATEDEAMAVERLDRAGAGAEAEADAERWRSREASSTLGDGLDKTATADQVMALLRSRALDQSHKRRSRQPPRSRQRRSHEAGSTNSASPSSTHLSAASGAPPNPNHHGDGASGLLSSSVTAVASGSSAGRLRPTSAASTAEELLALQAEREAQRAAEAAAQGLSLGLDRAGTGIGLGSGTQQSNEFDASLRVVYDDPAARKERQKLLDLVARRRDAQGEGGSEVEGRGIRAQLDQELAVAETEMEKETDGDAMSTTDAEGTGGAGTRRSPRKRTVVRKQPLARR